MLPTASWVSPPECPAGTQQGQTSPNSASPRAPRFFSCGPQFNHPCSLREKLCRHPELLHLLCPHPILGHQTPLAMCFPLPPHEHIFSEKYPGILRPTLQLICVSLNIPVVIPVSKTDFQPSVLPGTWPPTRATCTLVCEAHPSPRLPLGHDGQVVRTLSHTSALGQR